jgi:hypothetical protein
MAITEDCMVCKYAGEELECNFCWITDRCRTAMPKRQDGGCPAFEKGERIATDRFMDGGYTKKDRKNRIPYDQALAMYKAGKSDREIAQELRCATGIITRWRRHNALLANRPRQVGERTYNYGLFRELYNKGLNDHQISYETGAAVSTVGRWRNAEGLPPRRKEGDPYGTGT